MTTAHVEKFAELVGQDPALLAKLGLDKVNADAAAAAASAEAFCLPRCSRRPQIDHPCRLRIDQCLYCGGGG